MHKNAVLDEQCARAHGVSKRLFRIISILNPHLLVADHSQELVDRGICVRQSPNTAGMW